MRAEGHVNRRAIATRQSAMPARLRREPQPPKPPEVRGPGDISRGSGRNVGGYRRRRRRTDRGSAGVARREASPAGRPCRDEIGHRRRLLSRHPIGADARVSRLPWTGDPGRPGRDVPIDDERGEPGQLHADGEGADYEQRARQGRRTRDERGEPGPPRQQPGGDRGREDRGRPTRPACRRGHQRWR